MYELKFYNYGEGKCQGCSASSQQLYKVVVSSGEKSKDYILCRNCALKLKKQVDERNNNFAAKPTTAKNSSVDNGNRQNADADGVPSSNASCYKNTGSYNCNPQENISQGTSLYNQPHKSLYNKYQKLAGWLAVFCLTQIVSCLLSLFEGSDKFSDIKLSSIILFAVHAVFVFVIVKKVWTKKPDFLRWFFITETAIFICNIVVMISLVSQGYKLDVLTIIIYIIRTLVYCIFWTGYFIRSERCSVYFGGREFVEKSLIAKFFSSKIKK